MIGYKLFKKRKNGTLGSLFIEARAVRPMGEWLDAEDTHQKDGFAYRPFWHCCYQPLAPHLSMRGRVWCKVEMEGVTRMERPESQGGAWCLVERIKIIEEIEV